MNLSRYSPLSERRFTKKADDAPPTSIGFTTATDGTIAAQVKADTAAGKPGRMRVDFDLGHLVYCQPFVPKRVRSVVALDYDPFRA